MTPPWDRISPNSRPLFIPDLPQDLPPSQPNREAQASGQFQNSDPASRLRSLHNTNTQAQGPASPRPPVSPQALRTSLEQHLNDADRFFEGTAGSSSQERSSSFQEAYGALHRAESSLSSLEPHISDEQHEEYQTQVQGIREDLSNRQQTFRNLEDLFRRVDYSLDQVESANARPTRGIMELLMPPGSNPMRTASATRNHIPGLIEDLGNSELQESYQARLNSVDTRMRELEPDPLNRLANFVGDIF